MSRQEALEQLRDGTTFDLLIVGGGATGCGIAVDAASRGLKVALLERNDFAEGTSCRSTKLVHGGVRYLEKAVKRLDKEQYDLVKEGLHERGILLKNAPHLAHPLPFVTPLYRWIDVPQVLAGLKLYDFLAGKLSLGKSSYLSRKETLKRFPGIKAEGLKAGILYYDGQFNDARMAIALVKTAVAAGAVVTNHLEVTALQKVEGRVTGVSVKDKLTEDEWTISAKGVINATGPFGDQLRRMDDPQATPIMSASSGIHLVLDKKFAPPETGLMIPKTEDGRVLFVLPWQGHALIGTTDDPAPIVEHPPTTEKEIDYLLRHVSKYFALQVSRSDVKAAWSGLRPLVSDPKAADTSNLVRDHVISLSDTGLLTIVGGKWTSYRRMAEDTINQAVKAFALDHAGPCRTTQYPVVGGAGFKANGDQQLAAQYGLDPAVAKNMHHFYGDQANQVAELATSGYAARLHPDHPYIEAEVIYAAEHEFALHAIDVLVRRLPLALIDEAASEQVAPRVIELMAETLGWDDTRQEAEQSLVNERLKIAV